MQSFYLSVASAKEQRSEKYADNYYGPGMYEVKASYRSVDLIKVVVPTDVVDEMIQLGLRLRDTLAPGIDQASEEWDAAHPKGDKTGQPATAAPPTWRRKDE